MNYIFFPGCRIKEGYPNSSKKCAAYIKEKLGLDPVGCCKVDYTKLEEDTKALLICNNCANDLESLTSSQKEFVWNIIDQDQNFNFPDYQGRSFLLQDCDHGYNDPSIGNTVRSLLKKMNIQVIEMNKEDGIEYGLSRQEHREKVKKNACSYSETDIVTYCAICNLAMKNQGKNSYYLLDLLFEEM